MAANKIWKMSLLEYLTKVTDFRRAQGQRFTQDQMFSMIILGNLCGHFGGRPLETFTQANADILIAELNLKHKPPSHVSFSTFINQTDESQMIDAFNAWTADYVPLERGDLVSADGKALGATLTDSQGKNQNFQAIVSTFCQQSGLVYALERYENGKASEINVVRFLITQLNNMGLTLFLDALHCQKKRLKAL